MIPLRVLQQRQGLPLEAKVILSQRRIQEFYEKMQGDVYISFSGGKDSTVLLHLVRELYPDVPAVFVDTGLEYPEIKAFVNDSHNVTTIRPKMGFREVLEKYGYPVVSKEQSHYIDLVRNTKSEILRNKHLLGINRDGSKTQFTISKKWKYLIDAPFKISDRCCDVMKKRPFKKYERESGRKPFIGNMVTDSILRGKVYLKNGCNAFGGNRPKSTPMAFWLEEDVWAYIKSRNLQYCSIYDHGITRTGCMFCMFGVHLEKGQNRFQLMHESHPKLWDYCINKLGCGKVLDYIGVPCVAENDLFQDMVNNNDPTSR